MATKPLDATQQRRLEKLEWLLERLERGDHVQNKTLKNWLNAHEYQRLFDDWEQQQSIRAYWSSKPSAVLEYEERFRQAMFDYNRAEGYQQKGNTGMARRFYNKAQSAFEACLIQLESDLSTDPSIRAWFDRDLNFGQQGSLSLSPVGMPRVVTSRSLDNQLNGSLSGKLSKAEVKMAVIKDAIEAISSLPPPSDKPSLEELMKKLKQSRGLR
jgi:tetratricopeptide (TPR) repeat protein